MYKKQLSSSKTQTLQYYCITALVVLMIHNPQQSRCLHKIAHIVAQGSIVKAYAPCDDKEDCVIQGSFIDELCVKIRCTAGIILSEISRLSNPPLVSILLLGSDPQ